MDRDNGRDAARRGRSLGRARASSERGHAWVYGSDELYLLAERAAARRRVLRRLPADRERRRLGGLAARARARGTRRRCRGSTDKRIGVVTGVSMAALMPELLDAAARQRPARTFELHRRDELALRPDDDDRRAARRRRHSPRARRPPRSRSRADSRRVASTTTASSSTTSRSSRCASSCRCPYIRPTTSSTCWRTKASHALAGGAQRERSGRRAHRSPERRQVGAVQPHRRRRQRDRLRGSGHDARPPLRRDRLGRPRRSGSSTPAASPTIRRRRWTSRSAARWTRRSAKRTCCCSSSTRSVGLHPSDYHVAEMLRNSRKPWMLVANKVDDPRAHGLLRVLPARRRTRCFRCRRSTARDSGDLLDAVVAASCRGVAGAGGRAARRGDRPAERRQVVVREPAARRRAARRVRDRRHDARRDRHADAVSRPPVHLRRHGGPAPPEQDRRRHRVLFVAAHAPRDRARRHLHPHGRRDRGRDPESGSQDRRAGVGSGSRADRRRQQVGSRREGRQGGGEVPEGGAARRRRSSSSFRFCSRRRSPASA